MAVEIERKFLVKDESWRLHAQPGQRFIQGYLVGGKHASVRVRVEGESAFLNIKSATLGVRRSEYEYPLPVNDANEMLNTLCEKPLIQKTRYLVNQNGACWEIDVFDGDNTGLVVAEIELDSENSHFELPRWLGDEVSNDPRYYNVNLVKHPFKQW